MTPFLDRIAAVDVLDCTLRDGGHHNDWDFAPALVSRYLAALDGTGVRWVEVGYRTPAALEPGAGAWRTCPDDLLRRECAGSIAGIALMVETKFLWSGDADATRRTVARLLAPRQESVVGLVRIATTAGDLAATACVIDAVRALGYDATVNLMRASTLGVAQVTRAATALRDTGAMALYVADSFGGLLPDATRARIAAAGDGFRGRVGFHAHDNMGLALANSIAAIEAGATLVDASVRGMGRGGGNLRTELLLLWLEKSGRADVSARPLLDLVADEFAALDALHPWGPTVPAMLSGLADLHPDAVAPLACR